MEFNFFLVSLTISEALLIWAKKKKSWEELNKYYGMNYVALSITIIANLLKMVKTGVWLLYEWSALPL